MEKELKDVQTIRQGIENLLSAEEEEENSVNLDLFTDCITKQENPENGEVDPKMTESEDTPTGFIFKDRQEALAALRDVFTGLMPIENALKKHLIFAGVYTGGENNEKNS